MTLSVPIIISGFGSWVINRTVIPLITQYPELMEIVAITSVTEKEFNTTIKPEFIKKGLTIPVFIEDFETCINHYSEDKKPLAVLITTPNFLHYTQAEIAIKAGYHVYVERPIVGIHDNLPNLVDLADEHNVLLFTGTQRRLEAPFQYLKKVVTEHYEFDNLKRIRCRLAMSQRLTSWRRKINLAGGGIIIDSGYHLLDIVAWLLGSLGIEIPENLKGYVCLGFDESIYGEPISVETEAFGYVNLPNGIVLSFDFTYNAPENSIYEQIEVNDQSFGRLLLTRDQVVRTTLPAIVTHQLSNGKFVEMTTALGVGVRTDAIRFSGEPQNTEPLRVFVEAIQKSNPMTFMNHVLHARNSIATWHLVKGIYHLSEKI